MDKNNQIKRLLMIFPFLFFTWSNIYTQTNEELERYKKEQQQKLDEYKKNQNQAIEAYKKKQQEEIEKLRKEFLKYEKEREAEIAAFKNKNINPTLQKKAAEAEKKNKLNDSPQVVEIEKEAETNTPIEEAKKEAEVKVVPKKVEADKKKIEIEANRPVFFPVDKKYPITSHYNKNRVHPVLKKKRPHNGIDFGAPKGTPVYAPADGIVEIARFSKSAGNWVMINHQNGYKTVYMHFDKLGVKEGQQVKRGQVIGYIGNTGYSTGPHLHYEVRHNNVPVNPVNFLVFENS
jgi:murein DD-endopeptidase MepM/ murein hydrolase activator NlpD